MFVITHKMKSSYIYYPCCHGYVISDIGCLEIFPKRSKIITVEQNTSNTGISDTYQNSGNLIGNKAQYWFFGLWIAFSIGPRSFEN